jgi:hypothetical protein
MISRLAGWNVAYSTFSMTRNCDRVAPLKHEQQRAAAGTR